MRYSFRNQDRLGIGIVDYRSFLRENMYTYRSHEDKYIKPLPPITWCNATTRVSTSFSYTCLLDIWRSLGILTRHGGYGRTLKRASCEFCILYLHGSFLICYTELPCASVYGHFLYGFFNIYWREPTDCPTLYRILPQCGLNDSLDRHIYM